MASKTSNSVENTAPGIVIPQAALGDLPVAHEDGRFDGGIGQRGRVRDESPARVATHAGEDAEGVGAGQRDAGHLRLHEEPHEGCLGERSRGPGPEVGEGAMGGAVMHMGRE